MPGAIHCYSQSQRSIRRHHKATMKIVLIILNSFSAILENAVAMWSVTGQRFQNTK